ncbi:FAD binding domain-containing protein [Desertimonas flava]|uniref:FAD binding domain-containing protein n=1 Tax=Desertimonas flava TaxID=2064846 RepID=UPI0013C4DAAF|nr:FAD binding domain-containing protein [Desertimonas flava]
MSVLPELELVRPTSIDEALAVIDENHAPYAGATELVPALRLGVRFPIAIVDLKRIDDLGGITAEADQLRLGAVTTHRELASSDIVRDKAPTLAAAAGRVGNARVRSTGTIGGNLCFAEPRSDLATLLVALGATVDIAGPSGSLTMSVDDFIVGAFETRLGPDELLVGIRVPFEPAGTTYWKLQSYERPTIGVAVVPVGDRRRVVVGAATERPVAGEFGPGDAEAVESFTERLGLSDDLAGSAEYKRAVLRGYLAERLDHVP